MFVSVAAIVTVLPDWDTLTFEPAASVTVPVVCDPLTPTLVTVFVDDISIVLPDLETVVAPLSVNVIVSPEPIASAKPVFALILNEPKLSALLAPVYPRADKLIAPEFAAEVIWPWASIVICGTTNWDP